MVITVTDPEGNTSVIMLVNGLAPSKRKIVPLPYIKGFSERLGCSLRKFDLTPVFSVNSNLRSVVTKGKDRTDEHDKCNVVYKIQCNDCSASYVGETKRELKTRLKEHKDNLKKNPEAHSVVSTHQIEFNHTFDWDNAVVLDRESVWSKRITSEMLRINLQPNSLNKKEDTKKLHLPYSNMLHRLRSKSCS